MQTVAPFRLFHGDCLDILPKARGPVDMVLCDLPYGVTQNKWDSVIPLDRLWVEYRRLSRGPVVLTAVQPFSSQLVLSSPVPFRYEWIWEKNIASDFLNAKRQPMRIHENILVFSEERPEYTPQFEAGKPYTTKRAGKDDSGSNYGEVEQRTDTVNDGRRYPKTILRIPREIGLHPTQKPVALMEYLIRTYTNEGDTVLDNCMGSGTTGVACLRTGRNFVGIEQDEKHFQTAKERIEREALCHSKT